ncbi:MAG: DUF1059 domain-containing protein [Acidimicrobiia bacterium]|nr:DUF1059 domain-containing protein [Acidimicrobiia bacterium]
MKRFECTQVVPGCEGVVEAESTDEVLAAASHHAAQAHGLDPLPADVVAKVRAGITDV